MQKKAHDWQILDLYSRSWQIVKKNKILWLFGIAASTGSLGGMNFNFSSFNNFFQKDDPASTPEKLTQVLGDSTSILASRFGEMVTSVPVWQYALLGLLVLLVIIVGLILDLVYQAWVNGSLIAGASISSTKKTATISDSSRKSFPAIKGMIWLSIVPTLIITLASMVVFGALAVAIVILPSIAKLLPALLLFIMIFVFIYIWILFTLAQIWASREVILDRKLAFAAFKHSIRVVKTKYWKMVLLAVVNTLLSMAVTFSLIIPMVILLMIGVFGLILIKDSPLLIFLFSTLGLLLLLICFLAFKISTGVLNSFKACVWTLAYQQTRGESND